MKYIIFKYKEKDEEGNLDIVEYYTGKDRMSDTEKYAIFDKDISKAKRYKSLMVTEKVLARLHFNTNVHWEELGIEEIE